MDGTFVDAIVRNTNGPEIREGRVFVPGDWKEMAPAIRSPKTLGLATLTGLRDYLDANIDALEPASLILHVMAPDKVMLRGPLGEPEQDYTRPGYLLADVPGTTFTFGQYQDAETFTIGLMSKFVSSEERNNLIALIASIRESDVRETLDDGVGQEVKTARGVALVDRTKVPNPVTLAPYRTFREVAQPPSSFVLRLKTGNERPHAALFEADGGAWQLEAIANVAAWLRANTSVKVVA